MGWYFLQMVYNLLWLQLRLELPEPASLPSLSLFSLCLDGRKCSESLRVVCSWSSLDSESWTHKQRLGTSVNLAKVILCLLSLCRAKVTPQWSGGRANNPHVGKWKEWARTLAGLRGAGRLLQVSRLRARSWYWILFLPALASHPLSSLFGRSGRWQTEGGLEVGPRENEISVPGPVEPRGEWWSWETPLPGSFSLCHGQ